MRFHARLLAALVLATAGCATVPAGQPLSMRPPEAVTGDAPEFVDQGRIQFTPMGSPGASAAWDARSVRGPAVNMTLTDEGLWGGTIRNRAVLLRAGGGRITGEGTNLYVTQEGPVVHVQGMWANTMLRIDVSPTTLSASPTAGVCGIEMALAPDGYWRGFGGCGGRLSYTWMTLHGVAGDPSAEMPQWLFAFLASLPSPQTTVFPTAGFASMGGPPGWFLPAEFRGPAPWNLAMGPCSPHNHRFCGPPRSQSLAAGGGAYRGSPRGGDRAVPAAQGGTAARKAPPGRAPQAEGNVPRVAER
jgi:hypothetical protein